ncbi:MAG TPA: O-antigen ligase family protein [Solirubrobacteraceae bacterium]|nr:O-antigen ligase family protein [Solirubrobacteraceae bacterium]
MRIVQVYAVVMLVIPSDIGISAIGGASFPAGLVGIFAFAAWAIATLFGLHDPRSHRNPIRAVLLFLWAASLISYLLIDRGALGAHQLKGADRYLMELTMMTGVAFLAAECLTSLDDVRRVLRAVCWGGAFCGAVAALQFWIKLDISPVLRKLPGFSVITDSSGIGGRDAVSRVVGTATHPIELGIVSAMILPLAIWLAIYDGDRSQFKRWAPVALIAVSAVVSVSRSAIVCVALAMAVFVVAMPARQRVVAISTLPMALAGVFVSAHGLIRALLHLLGVGNADPSIAHRVNTYTYVEQVVSQAPWFGHGVGTYIADSNIHILDNEYLKTLIESGIVGAVALLALFLVPMFASLLARHNSRDPALRLLCAATAGAALAAGVGSAMFDSFSFNMFFATLALVLGLTGAAWRLVIQELQARDAEVRRPTQNYDRPPPTKSAPRARSIEAQGA